MATNGEALYRVGVTREEPAGVAWSHVRSDLLFQVHNYGPLIGYSLVMLTSDWLLSGNAFL